MLLELNTFYHGIYHIMGINRMSGNFWHNDDYNIATSCSCNDQTRSKLFVSVKLGFDDISEIFNYLI